MQNHTNKIYIALEETAATNTLHQVLKVCPPINATDIDGYNFLPKTHRKIADVIFSLAVVRNPKRQHNTLKHNNTRRDSKNVNFAVGDHIEALWEGGEDHYPGIITCVHSKGTFDVLYDDGDRESEVPGNRICFKELKVGTRVEALWERGSVFYPGKVVKVKGGGKYDIQYDDGDYESSVPRSLMRQITSKNVNDVNTPMDIGKFSSNIKEEQDVDDNSRIKSNSTSVYIPAKSSPKHHTSLKAGPVLKKARTATHQTKMTKTQKPDEELLPTEVKVENVERPSKNDSGQNPQLSRKVALSSRVDLSDYELSRQKRISENNAVLAQLGLNTSRGGVSSIRESLLNVSKQVKSLGLKQMSKRKWVEPIVSHKSGVLSSVITFFALYENRDGTH